MFHQLALRFLATGGGSRSDCSASKRRMSPGWHKRRADRIERREADRPRFAGLQDREVGKRDADPFGELGQRHAPIVQHVVELDDDHSDRPFEVSRMSVPSAKTRARMNVRSTAIQPLTEKPASRSRGCAGWKRLLAIAAMTRPSS